MLECLKKINKEKTGLFAAGVLFGTAGIKILTSKDAKKFYTQCTAAVLRAKECVMKTVTSVQENWGRSAAAWPVRPARPAHRSG